MKIQWSVTIEGLTAKEIIELIERHSIPGDAVFTRDYEDNYATALKWSEDFTVPGEVNDKAF